METKLTTPLDKGILAGLRAGDRVLLSGEVYTARDAAHKRMFELIDAGKPLPIGLVGACIYYAGPTPAPPGHVIGSVGPTTSGRMDRYTPLFLKRGLAAMVGKGSRSDEVLRAIREHGAVYFGFIGGAGALAAACVKSCETLAFEDLGSEAVRRLVVEDLPLTVLADANGGDLYKSGKKAYLACKQNAGL